MGGKKKKTLANRLARMSDEERMRYMMHKAELEEEAKRRKEQLIVTFMKNKIKKEDAFSRLNLAKINQNWHQILRQSKCNEMKDNIVHLRDYIERVVATKNRTIDNLLEELAFAEEQYNHNFQTHSGHIDRIIASHHGYLTEICQNYDRDRHTLLDATRIEQDKVKEESTNQLEHLRTLIYAVYENSLRSSRNNYEAYLKRNDEITSTHQLELEQLKKSRTAIAATIWQQIGATIHAYIEQTDATRMHLAELKRLDADSAVDIANNQDRIARQETELDILSRQYNSLASQTDHKLKRMIDESARLSDVELKLKRDLKTQLDLDERKLIALTTRSSDTVASLEELCVKGEQIVTLMRTCRKLETDRDRIHVKLAAVTISCEDDDDRKPSKRTSAIARCLNEIQHMERFWLVYNQAAVDMGRLKAEKRALLEDNEKLKGMVRRTVLEEQAADSNGRRGGRSGVVGAFSAPAARRIVF